jgi:hypothetical protein
LISGVSIALVFVWLPLLRRKKFTFLQIIAAFCVLGALSGCGGGGHAKGTTTEIYKVTVTGTGNDPAASLATTTFSVTVN